MTKLAVVAFNLGGPDKPESIRPFLFNLFNDPAIIAVPNPVRWLLARFISGRRAPLAREIYEHLGGKSPLVELTRQQCHALEDALGDEETEANVFMAMRYWHPMSLETAERVRDFDPDEVVLLPLYPQFSTTTTGSSLKEWHRAAKAVGLTAPTKAVCCYPENAGWIAAQESLIGRALDAWPTDIGLRVLFSAHGLPKKIVAGGDPYQWQVERTAAAVMASLTSTGQPAREIDSVVCYQSRVGPLEWIGPSTEDELERAARDGVGVIVVPIAFVSEHSETLVELDIEYRELAEKCGVPRYERVPAVATHPDFIGGLVAAVTQARNRAAKLACDTGVRICPAAQTQCAMKPGL